MKTELILRAIGKHKDRPGELSAVFKMFFSGYQESYRRMRKFAYRGQITYETNKEFEKREKQNFYNLVNYLTYEGLIEKKIENNKKLLLLTKKGKNKVDKNNFRQLRRYSSEPAKETIIIIFDVPETFKRKREWLRQCLFNMKFTKIQKSVWVGQRKIPEDFLMDLKKLKMLTYIHILKAEKLGTLVGEKLN